MDFGESIKELRAAKSLTQQQLADAIGVNQSFVAKLERPGPASRLGADVLFRLCTALGVGCDHFRPFLEAQPAEQLKPKGKDGK